MHMSTTNANHTLRRRLTGTAAVVFWVVIWQLASMAVDSEFILAGPLDAVRALVRLVPTPEFWGQVAFSFVRIAVGTLAAYALAIALAAVAHRWRAVRTLTAPALSAIKGTPVACVVVVLLIWFGSRNVSAIAVFLMALPGIYFPVLKGLDELDPAMGELFGLFRADWRTRLLAHVIPGVLPYLTSASATVLSMSWKAGVAAELIGVPTGSIGERIYQAKLLLETADLFAWTIVVVVVAWAFEHAVLAAMRACWPAAGRLAARQRPASRQPALRHPVPQQASQQTTPQQASPQQEAAPTATQPATLAANSLVAGHGDTPAGGVATFRVGPGETLCLMGPSGAGKTTLLATVARQLSPLAGELTVPACTRFAAVFQQTRLVDDLTAQENVRLFAAAGIDAHALLLELLPEDALNVPVRDLSGGQRRRVELVRAFAAPADALLLDEPFTGLDEATRKRALAFIQHHQGMRPLLLSTHDRRDAEALDARVLTVSAKR